VGQATEGRAQQTNGKAARRVRSETRTTSTGETCNLLSDLRRQAAQEQAQRRSVLFQCLQAEIASRSAPSFVDTLPEKPPARDGTRATGSYSYLYRPSFPCALISRWGYTRATACHRLFSGPTRARARSSRVGAAEAIRSSSQMPSSSAALKWRVSTMLQQSTCRARIFAYLPGYDAGRPTTPQESRRDRRLRSAAILPTTRERFLRDRRQKHLSHCSGQPTDAQIAMVQSLSRRQRSSIPTWLNTTEAC
jgi:hypothetical protein